MIAAAEPESGLILAECKALLADLRRTYAGDPQGEYRRLAMLALEREQLVSYAYREDVLGQRLNQLTAPPVVIEIMRHAFTQVWRDEEAHTVLIRGTLVADERSSIGLARTTAERTAGWLAGWSASIKHHVPRSSAPLRTLLVDGLAQAARLVGKLSPDLRAELKSKSFRDFCLYNVDAEETAELCWHRLTELERELGGSDVKTFARIACEEREHRDVFEVVADVLDQHDWLKRGVTGPDLSARLDAIDSRFVVGATSDGVARNGAGSSAFGSGAAVHVLNAQSHTHCEALNDALDLLGPVDNKSVVVQASWMMGYSRNDPSSVVDPEALHHLVDELTRRGARPTVIDSANLYSDLFAGRSVVEVADHFGLRPNCPIVDGVAQVTDITNSTEIPNSTDILNSMEVPGNTNHSVEAPTLGPTTISRLWVEADVRISLVRLRSHPREHIHGSTANLESVIPGTADNVFWRRRYDHSVAALTVGIVAPPHLAIVDAWSDCPDGLFGLMAGPHVVHPGRVYASTDALSCDLVVMRHTGSARSVTSATLRRTIEWFGDPRPQIAIVGDDTEIAGWRNPYDNAVSGLLADLSYPVFAYLSRSGALFAPPMDDAFPEIAPPAAPLRVLRAVGRRVLGLRPPSP